MTIKNISIQNGWAGYSVSDGGRISDQITSLKDNSWDGKMYFTVLFPEDLFEIIKYLSKPLLSKTEYRILEIEI